MEATIKELPHEEVVVPYFGNCENGTKITKLFIETIELWNQMGHQVTNNNQCVNIVMIQDALNIISRTLEQEASKTTLERR